MDWKLHWQCCFQSLGGTQYAVNIYDRDYTGDVVQLTCAEEPFVTQEDDSGDIFTPIRAQTGYLRIIDMDGTLMEMIIPMNNTEKLVRLYSGTYTGTWPNGEFTETALEWHGFLQAQAYTQPWDGQANMIEFPVKSLLGVMEDVSIEGYNTATATIASIIFDAFSAVNTNPQKVYIQANLSNLITSFFYTSVNRGIFFQEEKTLNLLPPSEVMLSQIGDSWYDVLAALASLYGLMLREKGGCLYITMYDESGGRLQRKEIPTWDDFVELVDDEEPTIIDNTVEDVDMLENFVFAGNNNRIGYQNGYRNLFVTLPISKDEVEFAMSILELPDSQTPLETVTVYKSNEPKPVYVQPYPSKTSSSSGESFSYYRCAGQSSYELISNTNYEGYNLCLNTCIVRQPNFDPVYSSGTSFYSGAFHCRWFFQDNAQQIVLKDGLFLNQIYLDTQLGSGEVCYTLSGKSHKFEDGYININFNLYNFFRRALSPSYNLMYGDTRYMGNTTRTHMYFALRIGTNTYWNGSNWVTRGSGDPMPYFTFDVIGTQIVTNKTAAMNVSSESGYFIPVSTSMTGALSFIILNFSECSTWDETGQTTVEHMDNHSKIMSDLTVTFLKTRSALESSRETNTYYKKTLISGFSGEKKIDLTVGTYNNNIYSRSLIRNASDTDYIQTFRYTSSQRERPEINLINRMAAQYATVRRTAVAVRETDGAFNIAEMRATHNGQTFFGIDARHRWADDKQEVKFIEVS